MVIVLTGKNIYLVNVELKNSIESHLDKYGDSIERFDGSEIDSVDGVLDAVRSVSFLDPQKLVVVKNFAQSKDLLESLENIIQQTAESTKLVLADPNFDKRTSLYKKLQKTVEFKVFEEINPFELEKWLINQAKEQGTELGRAEAKLLVERVGANQQQLFQEIKKLSINGQIITKNDIIELTDQTPQSRVFDMLDALFSGRGKKAWSIYQDQRKQGEEPQKIIGMITWQLQQLTLAVFAPDNNKQTLMEAGVSPYSAQKSMNMAKHITKTNMKHYITELAELDAQSKTNTDVESALSVYFADVALRQTIS